MRSLGSKSGRSDFSSVQFSRSLWRPFDERTSVYVGRCGFCGRFESGHRTLFQHWFFRGPYCESCITDVLYDNCRTIQEVNNSGNRIVRCVVHGNRGV